MPTVGGDLDGWGSILNIYLNVSHNDSGQLRNDTVSSLQIVNDTIVDDDISDLTNLTLGQKITFAFGEIIDNIVDGWITITGGLRVEGKGNFSGTIYINNGTDVATLGGGSSTNISDYYRVYETAWINRSDWTNVHLGSNAAGNVDSNVTHNLNAPLSDLMVKVLISTGGAVNDTADLDVHSFEPHTDGPSLTTGWTAYQIDNNRITVQTEGSSGLSYNRNSDGTSIAITAQNWWYKIKVSKRNGFENNSLTYCMKTTEDTVTSNTIWGESGGNVFVQNTSRNVGIGTTSPSAKLEVNGSLNVTGNITASGSINVRGMLVIGQGGLTNYADGSTNDNIAASRYRARASATITQLGASIYTMTVGEPSSYGYLY